MDEIDFRLAGATPRRVPASAGRSDAKRGFGDVYRRYVMSHRTST
jgi:hypothetical protein